jgi:transcriptional regulator with XRE-family HTH domain
MQVLKNDVPGEGDMSGEKDFALRLKLTREALNLRQKEFAAGLNISATSYSEIESGKYKPNYEFLYNVL